MTENGRRKGEGALLTALAAGLSVRDAARRAGIGERTAYRHMQDPAFARRVEELRAETIAQAAAQLADAASEAVRALRGLLTSQSETVRLSAARSVLELGPKLRESAELEGRLLALEAALAAKEHV